MSTFTLIGGVTLELYDDHGAQLGTTTTDADGHYSFGVVNATYEVRVAAANFAGPHLLALLSRWLQHLGRLVSTILDC